MRLMRPQTEGTHPKIKSPVEEKGVEKTTSPQNSVSLTPGITQLTLTWDGLCGRRRLEVAAHCAAL